MFGIVCGGRPVDTNFAQVDPAKYAYVIQDSARINHMAIFMIPGAVLPPGAAAAVYAQLPGKDFVLLGALTAEKPSAIFRFNTSLESTSADVDAMMDDEGSAAAVINLGIALEPAEDVARRLFAQRTAPKSLLARPSTEAAAQTAAPAPTAPEDIAALANKIIAHAYNYMSSFMDANGLVPIKAFNDWWTKFKSRVSSDPMFLNNLN